MNWTLEYEKQPVQGSNPGFIAQSVRNLKTAISERLELEHFFGAGEGLTPGRHREGSARVFILDDEAARTDIVTSDTLVGRTRVDLQVMTAQPDIDGVAQTGVLNNTIAVWDEGGTLVDVFAPTDHVSRTYDTTITGRKIYTSTNPEVQENLDDISYDAFDAPAQARADEKAMKRSDIKFLTDEAKDFNIFDSEDTDNTTEVDASSPTGTVVLETIESKRIHGTVVTGAVWG